MCFNGNVWSSVFSSSNSEEKFLQSNFNVFSLDNKTTTEEEKEEEATVPVLHLSQHGGGFNIPESYLHMKNGQ